jgi:aryl-alcohol dehydrogenase-like predicted oxidoreductase
MGGEARGHAVMIEQRTLGKDGPAVGCLGYGAMVLESYYRASDDTQAIETIGRALDVGMTMIDSADAYGNGHSEVAAGPAGGPAGTLGRGGEAGTPQ